MITSDKCYENREQMKPYDETDAMGGYDPYSSSKGAAEIAISSWRRSFMNPKDYATHGKSIASVRAGNVIGGGDWTKDRIVPDCIRAIETGNPIEIRNPKAIRPWQHVLEPLAGYMLLAEKMWEILPIFVKVGILDLCPNQLQTYRKLLRKLLIITAKAHCLLHKPTTICTKLNCLRSIFTKLNIAWAGILDLV
jgi:CDP-glucose 4,6-dehydratase